MRVLHVIGSFYPATRHGGLQRAVLRLCQGLASEGVEVEVATTDLGRRSERDGEVEGVPVRYFRRVRPSGYYPSPSLAAHLWNAVARFDLVHATGLFTFPTAASVHMARAHGVPCVVSPSGMASPWPLRYRGWKKRPYWWALERHNLRAARALHATSELEAEDLRALFPSASVFVVPNAVAGPLDEPPAPRLHGRVVFLGRIHPIKGLELLVEAMSRVNQRRPEAELVLAGPDEGNHWSRLREVIARCTPPPRVRFVGEVRGGRKRTLLATASALALTSHSESFGLVVAEALSYGTPVVVTKGCPWRSVEEAGAGRWVDPTPSAVAEGLLHVLAREDEDMESAARRLAESFRPARVGAMMAARYAEIVA